MQINPNTDQALHNTLPIDKDEKIIAVYKHHWFAYVSSWVITGFVVIGIVAVAVLLTSVGQGPDSSMAQYRVPVIIGAAIFGLLVIVAGMIPVHLRSREHLVLTDESLLRVLQPTLFSSKVDQLGLQHLADVSVQQDFLGTMFGFGHVLIETPGEQKTNYDFYWVANPREVARKITATHETFDADLQSGRLGGGVQPQGPAIDPQEFEEFLEFQKMEKMQQQQAAGQNGGTPAPGQTPQDGMDDNNNPQPPAGQL